jgi:hypothetical protein
MLLGKMAIAQSLKDKDNASGGYNFAFMDGENRTCPSQGA